MKIGIDIHNVLDKYPAIFKNMAKEWILKGHEVHIITGQTKSIVRLELEEIGIEYTHFYSIVDHHRILGTKMWTKPKKTGWWMDAMTWKRSKGNYANTVGLDCHFDDTLAYASYFPSDCTFIHVKNGFDKVISL